MLDSSIIQLSLRDKFDSSKTKEPVVRNENENLGFLAEFLCSLHDNIFPFRYFFFLQIILSTPTISFPELGLPLHPFADYVIGSLIRMIQYVLTSTFLSQSR